MLLVRRSDDRGSANFGWLDSKHTFSFGSYYDPDYMGIGPLRVINEDRVIGGAGFGTHGHQDMEIISYVLAGALEHKDSLGNGSVLRPGDVQRMSAGTGVRHSEYNHSPSEPVHFLQIWIVPERQGLAPSYEERRFEASDKRGRLRLIGARDGRDGAVTIHQDVDLYASILAPQQRISVDVRPERALWIQVARGEVVLTGETQKAARGQTGGETLTAGDGAAHVALGKLTLRAEEESEVLVFDLAV